ncbi:Tim44 domain-containing protein [Bradyrhizobium erythrophlei]|uniref:Predicted lipid-binding transport protein, Tim44 family n=1 Tax=Bradyrhizobium erythrophlei TaxID=1437360 RepID=A0A1M5UXF8_9BRAD|nr:Tim44 domain-containing protein [Bradyrhizobium erythrophlei]SHH67383.1 Predicted lipid-binding transport protein, Tim44 family [Bradyrhizobium erythrophlei]
MTFTQRARGAFQAIAVVLSLALPLISAISPADARVGGGFSSGSRGSRTFSAPPSTSTAPGSASPFNRTITQPGSPGVGAPAGGGFFNSPGRGMLGGLAAGFLGAGLLGMLFGGGMFSGIGGLSSIFGLILQIGLIVIVIRMAMSWWQRRHANPAYAGASPASAGAQSSFRSGTGFGLGSTSAPLEIVPADYEAFERLLGDIQAAWSDEDVARLHTLATPEMVSYFTADLQQNRARNVINKVSNLKLLQGDLAEAWREGDTDYASVAMRYALVDKTTDRTTGRLVEGSDAPTEATEVWTFVRPRGANWELSAIQQT